VEQVADIPPPSREKRSRIPRNRMILRRIEASGVIRLELLH
jgi:hypothetical protein